MQTADAKKNQSVLQEVARDLYDFLAETIEGTGLGRVSRGFDELDQEELAVFTVRSRLIVRKIMEGWK